MEKYMDLNERYKKFPIKFYQTDNGIYYENGFMQGKAKDLKDAFEQLKSKLDEYELFYSYDDVTGTKIGTFEPALKERKTPQGTYIGKLNLDVELNDTDTSHSIKYLSKNPDTIKDHEYYIKKLKNAEKRKEFFDKLKQGIKKVAGYLKPVSEMFSPYKSREDLICDHCGDIIPIGTYYEEWKRKNYHLECIWDKLCNDKKSNEHEKAEEYFLSLEKLLDNWDYSMDCPDDYESDLELYKVNKRNLGL